jgi:hypothetical protein
MKVSSSAEKYAKTIFFVQFWFGVWHDRVEIGDQNLVVNKEIKEFSLQWRIITLEVCIFIGSEKVCS